MTWKICEKASEKEKLNAKVLSYCKSDVENTLEMYNWINSHPVMFRVNTDFITTAKDSKGNSLGKVKICKGREFKVISQKGNYTELELPIGWIHTNNRIWKYLDLC